MADRLRALPSVDRLATAVARAELADRRAELPAGSEEEVDLVARARDRLRSSLRPVLNATGVIVRTNLGRAPLAPAARAAVAGAARGYSNLEALAGEPPVRRSVRAGAALVAFSGDKLLGGPQAGILVGTRAAVAACRRHPLARAVRIDKLSLAALEATLALYRDPALARRKLPVLAMLTAGDAKLRPRAERLAAAAGGAVVEAAGRVGGGALPLLELPGPVVALDPGLALLEHLDAARVTLRLPDDRRVLRHRAGS